MLRTVAGLAVPEPDREAYGARQSHLLQALLRGEDYPEGFVVAQAAASGHSLRTKRGRGVARAWPALALELGDQFGGHFDAFARATEAPTTGGPLADGLAFARWIRRERRLGDDTRAEALLARATLCRRGVFIAGAWLRRPVARLLVVARLPLVGSVHRSFASRR